jgi:Tfp pilus assembly protein PilO
MINKEVLRRNLKIKKVTDYSYTILFFLSFAFFTFFVIRPNILTILSLQEESGRLHILDTGYENVIKKIVDIQTFLEDNRSDLYLLDDALPSTPNINKIVDDTQTAASASAIQMTSMAIHQVSLKDTTTSQTTKSISLNIEAGGTFTQTKTFIETLVNERRLKNIKQIVFNQEVKEGSRSGQLKLQFAIEGYYL